MFSWLMLIQKLKCLPIDRNSILQCKDQKKINILNSCKSKYELRKIVESILQDFSKYELKGVLKRIKKVQAAGTNYFSEEKDVIEQRKNLHSNFFAKEISENTKSVNKKNSMKHNHKIFSRKACLKRNKFTEYKASRALYCSRKKLKEQKEVEKRRKINLTNLSKIQKKYSNIVEIDKDVVNSDSKVTIPMDFDEINRVNALKITDLHFYKKALDERNLDGLMNSTITHIETNPNYLKKDVNPDDSQISKERIEDFKLNLFYAVHTIFTPYKIIFDLLNNGMNPKTIDILLDELSNFIATDVGSNDKYESKSISNEQLEASACKYAQYSDENLSKDLASTSDVNISESKTRILVVYYICKAYKNIHYNLGINKQLLLEEEEKEMRKRFSNRNIFEKQHEAAIMTLIESIIWADLCERGAIKQKTINNDKLYTKQQALAFYQTFLDKFKTIYSVKN